MGTIYSMSQLRGPVSAVLLIIFASTVSAAPASDWRTRVSPDLLAVYDAATTTIAPSIKATPPSTSTTERSPVRFDASGRVQVDVNFDCANAAPTNALKAAGLVVGTTVKVPPICVVEGWASTAAVPSLTAVTTVKMVELPHYAKSPVPIRAGGRSNALTRALPQAGGGATAIDGNGVTIMNADKYIARTGVNGAGVTVGVINQGADSLSLIQGRSELPQVDVVQPSANPTPPANLDEGTMMLEEAYAVAPGASLAFCGPQTYVEYIACINALIAANVTVITDDLLFPGYDVMSDPAQNAGSQAIESLLVANAGVMLFSAAENNAKNYWQGVYTPVPVSGVSFTCQGHTDTYFEQFTATSEINVWTLGGPSASDLLLGWLNQGKLSAANYDLYVLDGSGNVVACAVGSGSTVVSGATSYDVILSTSLSSPNTYYIVIGTSDTTMGGEFIKLIGFGDGADSWSVTTPGSTSSPQDFAAGVIAVGAVDGGDGVGAIEPYSATGPIEFASGLTIKAPILVAPDDIYVDNVGTSFSQSMFTGTSAASPNAAAVAALLRSAFPTLTPSQVTTYMESGATQLGTSPWNGTFGYGRVDALGALAQIPGPTIGGLAATSIVGGTSSPPLPFAVGGTGALKVTALPSVFWMTAVISPSNCGTGAYNCTLTLTPAIGSFAPSTLQVSVTDGANRVQSMQIPVTVTKPAPPAVSISSGAAQSVQVNAAVAPINISVSGTGPVTVSATYNGAPVALTSGCGTTVMTCTANLGAAGTVTGPQSLNVTAQDSYGQSSFTSTTVTITNPPPPTITITSGASQSVMVNAAIAPVAFTLTGTGNLTVTPATNDVSSISISSGCGTTTMSCTASLGMAQSTAGTATLTLTVEDSYVQSATASATVTENAPPSGKSGGGALDPWALLGLTGLVLVQLNRPKRKRE